MTSRNGLDSVQIDVFGLIRMLIEVLWCCRELLDLPDIFFLSLKDKGTQYQNALGYCRSRKELQTFQVSYDGHFYSSNQ